MGHLFSYRDESLYAHHTRDIRPDPATFSMHAHEWMEIYYFISGQGSYLVEGNRYPLSPGDVFVLRSAEAHRLAIEPEVPYERIAIHFSPALLAAVDPEERLLRPFRDRPLGQNNRYSAENDAAGHLAAAFADFSFEAVPDVRLNLTGRLLLILTALGGLFERGAGTPVRGGAQSQLVAYINEHLFEDISVQSVADAFYRSRSQTARIFRQATGTSIWEYIKLKRLLAARAMLQRGESAAVACARCGFSDYSSFFRAYRAQFGHSPKEDSPN